MVWAFIAGKPQVKLSLKDIMSHCRAELPNYMVPDQVSFIDQIPKTQGAGKVDFEKLKSMAIEEFSLLQGAQNG
jgi:acyl-CoA synthetase (AMP-forming)/AMP-acid ligase II